MSSDSDDDAFVPAEPEPDNQPEPERPPEPSIDEEPADDDAGLELEESPVDLPPPEFDSRFGALGNAWRQYRHHKKRKRYASAGYVKWYLIEDSWPKPRYIKPSHEGGGEMEYEHDDKVYLFPREAMLADKRTGTWTVVHREGELDPIALQEPEKYALDADAAKQWLDLRVTSTAPGWLEGLDLDTSDIMMYLIVGIIALAVGQQLLGGGI
jgi:hypothetical protein